MAVNDLTDRAQVVVDKADKADLREEFGGASLLYQLAKVVRDLSREIEHLKAEMEQERN